MAPISTYNNSTPWTSMQDPNDGPHSTYNNNTAVQNTLRPGYVQYQPGYNSSMALAPEIDKRLAAIGPINTAGLDKFRGEAMRSGPSAWSQLALGQNTQREHDAMDAGATSVGSRKALRETCLTCNRVLAVRLIRMPSKLASTTSKTALVSLEAYRGWKPKATMLSLIHLNSTGKHARVMSAISSKRISKRTSLI